MSLVKFEAAAQAASRKPQFREFLNVIGGSFDLNKIDFVRDSQKARPFVTPMAWALFSAYWAIVGQAVVRFQMMKSGVTEDFADSEGVEKLVNTALPHQAETIKKFGAAAYHCLLDELEERILEEFRKMLAGREADKESVEKAAEILKLSNRVGESIRPDNIQADSIKRS
jgi:hypothetical protein